MELSAGERMRRIAGTAMLLVFIPLYALLAVQLAGKYVPADSIPIQTIYFAAAGLLWVLPAGLIIRWMLRPRRRA